MVPPFLRSSPSHLRLGILLAPQRRFDRVESLVQLLGILLFLVCILGEGLHLGLDFASANGSWSDHVSGLQILEMLQHEVVVRLQFHKKCIARSERQSWSPPTPPTGQPRSWYWGAQRQSGENPHRRCPTHNHIETVRLREGEAHRKTDNKE